MNLISGLSFNPPKKADTIRKSLKKSGFIYYKSRYVHHLSKSQKRFNMKRNFTQCTVKLRPNFKKWKFFSRFDIFVYLAG